MPLSFDIGDSDTDQSDVIPLAVHPGDSIVVTNVSGATLNVFGNGLNGGATSTIAPTANATFTTPTYIQSQGRTSCQISGGVYGS